jgi:hypothetical protein
MFRALVPLVGFALLFTSVLVGSAPAAPVPKHLMKKTEPVLYFPTTVGSKWVYLDNGTAETTYEVASVEDKDGGKLVTVTGGHSSPTCWQVSSAGLFIVSMGKEVCDPPVPMLRLPLADNKAWETEKRNAGQLKGLFAASGPEEVEVKAGKFQAIRVEMEWVGNNKLTVWYAPGVGTVKSNRGLHEQLKSFTPGKVDE